eukprot:768775-Hanusia_phi.AAC.2
MQAMYDKIILGEGQVRIIPPTCQSHSVQGPTDETKDDASTTQESVHAELVQALRERAVKAEREVSASLRDASPGLTGAEMAGGCIAEHRGCPSKRMTLSSSSS